MNSACNRFNVALVLALVLVALPQVGRAQGLPSVNLGFTSFLDGAPPAGPGFYFQEYLQYYHAGRINDRNGDAIHFSRKPDLDAYVSLNQLIYQSDQAIPLIGGKWGMDVIVPVVYLDLKPDDLPIEDNNGGLGDVVLGPFIQWDPIMGDKGPIFMHRIEFQNLLPTGKYDDDRALNPGSNFYSFDPYWAATLFIMPQWELTWRVHYLWNAENNDPQIPGADDTQAGQAIHLNFASSWELIPKTVHAGINGYYLKQTSDSQVDGNDIPNYREQVLGIGPGMVWHIRQDDHIFFNTYFETQAENRPEGIRLVLRWTHHF